MADTLGLMLTLIWTAGFLPSFLEGRNICVLLAKPAPRWVLLVGKYVGVLAFVLFQRRDLRRRHLDGDRLCGPASGIRPTC